MENPHTSEQSGQELDGVIRVDGKPGQPVITLTIDRPGKLNALTLQMVDQLEAALGEIDHSDSRVVVIRSAGEKVFCVGADIGQFSQLSPVGMWNTWIKVGHRVFDRLEQLRQPTIAVVDGHAFGGGLELALACDFRIVADTARLALPETGLGTVPGWGGTQRLTELVGRGRAKEMILARKQVDAATALHWGLATGVATKADLEGEVQSLIESLSTAAPLAQQVCKQIIEAAADGADARILEALASGFSAGSNDYRRGVEAFLNKTRPHFEGD